MKPTRYTASDPAVGEGYAAFMRDFSPGQYAAFLARLPAELRDPYRVATTPVFLARARYEHLRAVTQAVLRLLQRPEYDAHGAAATSGAPFPYVPLGPEDYFGAIDFHVSETTAKIIEVNLFPPGFSAFIERLEAAFVTTFLPGHACELAGYEARLCRAITAGGAGRVGIVSTQIEAHHRYPEFVYVQTLLAARQVETVLCSAEQLTADVVRPLERIFNRLIPSEWTAVESAVTAYTAAYAADPARFYTNPNGWYAADKRLLPQLAVADEPLIAGASLPCQRLSAFPDAAALEAAFPHRRSVLKPVSDYASHHVYVKPSVPQQRTLLDTDASGYVVQEFFPASEIPYVEPEATATIKFDVKIVFLDAAPVGAFARLYEGAMTNFRRPAGGIAPVVVV